MLSHFTTLIAIAAHRLRRTENGQATAEYALVVVAAGAVAVALIVWATNTGTLASLFNAVVRRIRGSV